MRPLAPGTWTDAKLFLQGLWLARRHSKSREYVALFLTQYRKGYDGDLSKWYALRELDLE